MVPMRGIFEAMGAKVNWDQGTRTVTGTKGGSTVILKIDSKDALADNRHIALDAAAVIVDGRTLVPLRFISESLGALVDWDQASRTVRISTAVYGSLYDTVKEGLEEMKNTIDVSYFVRKGASKDEVESVLYSLVEQTPDYFYVSLGESKYRPEGVLEISYTGSKDAVRAMKNSLKEKVEQVVGSVIKPGMDDYEKELALHEYIVTHTRYDEENVKNNTIPQESTTAYGVLMKGTGVCGGYSKAMKMLLDQVGIESMIIVGDADSGGNVEKHAWNLVKIGGEYYQLDVTWDDPVPDGNGRVHYAYFNVTDEQISATHRWEKDQYPACSSTKYNYFYKNSLVANSYSEFYFLLLKAVRARQTDIFVKVNNYSDSVYTSDVLQQVDNDPTLEFYAKSCYWGVDKDMGIIEITGIEYMPAR
jgi:hypothetical protein